MKINKKTYDLVIERLFDNNAFERLFRVRVVNPDRIISVYEETRLQKFLSYFKVDCVFDVGANEGQYAGRLRHAGYKGTIISFEPVPRALEKLHVKAKSDPHWIVEPVALDATSHQAQFNVMKVDQYSSLRAPSHEEVGELFINKNNVVDEISLETVMLRDMFVKHQKVLGFKRPYLKMDTQGSDYDIARGSEDILGSFVGLQSELSIKKLYEGTLDYAQLIEYYRSQGFELSTVIPNAGFFPDLVEIDCIMYNKRFKA